MAAALWHAEVRHYLPLIERIIAQSERRVLHGEAVPPARSWSACSSRMPTSSSRAAATLQYGHKLNLTTGRSGLILDVVIEAGNPADTERFLPMLERHIALLWRGAAAGRRRWRLCQPRQSRPGQGPRRPRCGLPQEARPAHRRHGQEPLGLSQAAQLPRRHRGRHLLPQARLRLWRAAPGAGSTTSKPTSGPRSSPTTSLSSLASSQPDTFLRRAIPTPAIAGSIPH